MTGFSLMMGLFEGGPSFADDPPKTVESVPCSKVVVIDGDLDEEEWKEAKPIAFEMPMVRFNPFAVQKKRKCELRVMNTAKHLYISLRVPNAVSNKSLEPVHVDLASLAFCQGKEVGKDDDRKVILASGQFMDKRILEPGKDEDDSQQNGEGSAGYEDGHYTFEWAVPLMSEDPGDLQAKPGDEFQFNIAFIDGFRADLKETVLGGIYGADLDHAKDWGKLRLSANVKEEPLTIVKIPKLIELPPYQGSGPGAWPVEGAIYEVCLENYPNHSLKELVADVPRLKQLGVTVIYLTPVFQCIGRVQYLITDYDAINPRYGTEEDLQTLVQTAHQNGIKVLLDLVTSIVYDGSKIVKHHPDWILRGKDGEKQKYFPIPEFGWALDCTHPEVIDYFSGVASRYIEKYDIDGWRIDSPVNNYDPAKVDGDHSRVQLLRAVRKAVDSVKKDAIFVAEISGPTVLFGGKKASLEPSFDEMLEASYDFRYSGFLGNDGYRIIEGVPLVEHIAATPLDSVVRNKLSSQEFVESITNRRILNGRLRANFIENHDTERVSKIYPKQHRSLFALIATIPGVPVVHCGQEVGSTVHPDVSGKDAVVDWEHGDQELSEYYTRVLKARANHRALQEGDIRDIWIKGDRCISYLRTAGNDRVIVALNFDAKPAKCSVRVPLEGKRDRVIQLIDEVEGVSTKTTVAELDSLEIALEPFGQQIISVVDGAPEVRLNEICGINFLTSNARNAEEMWNQFDASRADLELGWMSELGFNSVRLWLSEAAWHANPERFKANLDTCLQLAAKRRMTAMLVLFDCCGVEARRDAVEMTVKEAYDHYLRSPSLSEIRKNEIRGRYGVFAEGRGGLMRIPVARDSPPDVIFWQYWTPNPGFRRLGKDNWPEFDRYTDDVLEVAERNSNVIIIDVMNEASTLMDLPEGVSIAEAKGTVSDFVTHVADRLASKHPQIARTIGSSSLADMKVTAEFQTVLSVHSYALGKELKNVLDESVAFSRAQNKSVLLTECLANTNNWLVQYGEESLSTDEGQLRHYQRTVPLILETGIGFYSWGGIVGGNFTPMTDLVYPNGYLRPAAVYLKDQLAKRKATLKTDRE